MTVERLKKMLEAVQDAATEAFNTMLKSASDEDLHKYENLCNQADKLEAQLKEALCLEEKEDPENRGPKKKQDNLDEKISFVKKLREAIEKGDSFVNALPVDVAQEIQMRKCKIAKLRGYCSVAQSGGNYVIYIEGDDAEVSYVGEGSALTETNPSIEPLKLGALKLGCIIKVSNEYIADLANDVMAYLVEKLAKAFAKKEDYEILFGKGRKDSLINIRGIDTDTTVATIKTASKDAFTWEEVKKTIQKLGDYRDNAILVMHSDTLDEIQSFKNGDKYIFDQDNPLTKIMGCRVVLCNKMPQIGAGKTVIIAGDFEYYHLVDRKVLEIKTLYERYADTDQIGISAIERIDGDFVSDAFSKLVMATA